MKIHVIPAAPRKITRVHKKVAAYCRVSTQQEIQFHSLEAQAKYFREYIGQHPNWELAGIYADQASGRNNAHMKEFQRMMEDCRTGKIDLILVKSISRLGRNTVQFLQACDMLNALHVEVYFDIEKLYISDPKAVKMLTIYASLYQHESESKSFATRWGIVTRFRDGSSKICDWPCYGYRKTEKGGLVPDQEEAAVVRQIYRWKHDGCSLRDISARLIDIQVPCPGGGMKWHPEMVRRILGNEKYHGDIMLQKTYVADYFTGKRAINRGEYERYLIKGHHEAIIEDKAKD